LSEGVSSKGYTSLGGVAAGLAQGIGISSHHAFGRRGGNNAQQGRGLVVEKEEEEKGGVDNVSRTERHNRYVKHCGCSSTLSNRHCPIMKL
jgi:hypothetical protein